jgi:hypothetical protein
MEREHVQIDRLVCEKQRVFQRLERAFAECGDVELIGVVGIAEDVRYPDDHADIDKQDGKVGCIELEYPLQDPHGRGCIAFLAHDPEENQGDRVSGDEDEQVGGVAEAIIPHGHPAQYFVRGVVDKMAQLASPLKRSSRRSRPEEAFAIDLLMTISIRTSG